MLEGDESWHMKGSLVHQSASSRYTLTESQLGGRLSRHDLGIQQVILLPPSDLCISFHQDRPLTCLKAFYLCSMSGILDM